MSVEHNKAIVKRCLEEVWQSEDPTSLIDEIFAENVVINRPSFKLDGRDQFRINVTSTKGALHDIQVTIEAMIAEGDSVACRATFSGTHKGELMGVAPTGNLIDVSAIVFFRIEGDKVAEFWGVFDQVGILQQIGADPVPAQAS